MPEKTDDKLVQCLSDLSSVTDRSAAALKDIANELKLNRAYRDIENNKRIEYEQLKQDSAIVCELFARQSEFLASSIMKIEQRSGVNVSPTDLLAGIINGIQDSGVGFSSCGSREDVSDLIGYLVKLGLEDVGRRHNA